MPQNELRRDCLTNRWAVIATDRARRPIDLTEHRHLGEEQTQKNPKCPLCPGNEHMTPPAVLVYLSFKDGKILKTAEEREIRHKNWVIRCVPNLFPAFSPPKNSDTKEPLENDDFCYAIGHHEVLIESPDHTGHISDSSIEQITSVINAYKDRLSDLSKKHYVKYVQIFRNQGIESGASQPHPHSQIITTPFIPPEISQEIATSKSHWDSNKECLICKIIKDETETPRFITGNEHFIVIAPYASTYPMEFWILPKRHAINFLDITQAETEALAQTLKKSFKALKELIDNPPYNFGFHLALNKDSQDYYHWQLRVYPALSTWGGFEKSSGISINTVNPETAAAELRKMLTN